MSARRREESVRLQYWQGQRVTARDLRTLLDREEAHRAAHNRALHQSFGVSFGLEVTSRDVDVQVACGLAYDCTGRELVLQQTRTLALPRSDRGLLFLVLLRRDDQAGREAVESATELRWIPAARFGVRCGVPLARVSWDAQANRYRDAADGVAKLRAFQAPKSRALARLRMAAGTVESRRISWELLPNTAGLQVRVDTRAAGFFSERVHYRACLLWAQPNRSFAPPFEAVTQASSTGFTFRLLLPRTGGVALDPSEGVGFVAALDHAKRSITLQTAMFQGDDALIEGDVIARLTPQIDQAWPLQSITGDVLEPRDIPGPAPFAEGDLIVAANRPRQLIVTARDSLVLAEFEGDLSATQPAQPILIGESASGKVAVALIAAKHAGKLWLDTTLTTLAIGQKLVALGADRVVTSVDGQPLTFEPPYKHKKNVTVMVVRTKDATGASVEDLRKETVSIITGVSSGVPTFDPPLPVMQGESYAFSTFADTAPSATKVEAPEPLGLEVSDTAQIAVGDLVRLTHGSLLAFVVSVEEERRRVILDAPLELEGTTLEVADLGERSTVEMSFGDGWVWLGSPALVLRPGMDLIVVGSASTSAQKVDFVFPPYARIDNPQIQRGDVIVVPRFARRSNVVSQTGTRLEVEDASVFTRGEFVALGTGGADLAPLSCTVIAEIDGNTLQLLTALPETAGKQLTAITARAAAVVRRRDADGIQVTRPSIFRAGDLLGRFTNWRDASVATRLHRNGGVYSVEAWLDGLLPDDAVGFAAISNGQSTLRLRRENQASLGQALRLSGPSVQTNELVTRDVLVSDVEGKRASLSELAGAPFSLRPEQLSVVDQHAQRLPERFAAYALEQGVRLAWFGVQLPAVQDDTSASRTCLLQHPQPCACCEASSSASSFPAITQPGCCK